MKFEKINYNKGLRNFSQIWANEDELEIVAREYARLNNRDEEKAEQAPIKYDEQHKTKTDKHPCDMRDRRPQAERRAG